MTGARSYLDYNATAPLLPSAREAMLAALECVGNPSSVHREGREAKKVLEGARQKLASSIGARPANIIFTSGATEAAAHALCPIIRAGGVEIEVSKLFVSAIEHPCVLQGGRFPHDAIEILPVTEAGCVDLGALENALKAHDRRSGAAMVAVMAANNETGVLQPLEEIAALVHENEAFLTVDAVQLLGKLPFDLSALQAHFTILSGHKIGGPKGVGALVLGDGSISPMPLLTGGGQESYHRAGTENLAAIAGFAAAAAEFCENREKNGQIEALRDSIERGILTICAEAGNKAGEPVFFGRKVPRLPNTSCFAIPGLRAETALIALDLDGVAISSGSACSSGKVNKSHVLSAMGVDDEISRCALRVSAGPETAEIDATRLLGALDQIVGRIA